MIREEDNGMCKGIAQEKYCEFPADILQVSSQVNIIVFIGRVDAAINRMKIVQLVLNMKRLSRVALMI